METPVKRVTRSNPGTFGTPICIPATPLLHRLGFGTGVEVYRIQRTPSKDVLKSPWAVKRLTKRAMANSNNSVINDRLMKEAKILKKLKHPNVIGFRGMTKDEAGRNVLALETCTTSLHDVIELRLEEDSGPISSSKALKVIVDIAKALDYLHTTALILHGDVKAQNVLINGDFEICKLCDFGVASVVKKDGFLDLKVDPHASYVGTELWAGPEVFEDCTDGITTKTDIFAFGCTIYEMVTLSPPHLLMNDDEDDEDDSENIDPEDSLNLQLEERIGKRPPLPESLELGEDYNRVLEMFFLCTNALPEKRPTARNIVDELASTEEEK